MTNSTRCALLAKQACTTLSHVVQKITPPSANNFLKLFFALFAMLTLGVGNAWGAEVTYTFNTDAGIAELGVTKPSAGAGTDLDADKSYVLGDVSMKVTHNATNKTRVYNSNGNVDLRVYKNGGTLTFSVPSGSISKVVFAGTTTNVFTANVGTWSNPTWTGDAASVTFTATATGKINTITVTYETASGENPGEGGGEDPVDPTPGTGGESGSYTWNLSKKTYTTGTDEVTWTADGIATMHNAGTNATNYLGGDSNNRSSSRFYSNNTLTITPAANVTITSVEFTATSSNYATTLKNSTWNNATASVSGSVVTVTPTNGASAISATISGTCGFTGVTVHYTKAASGEPETPTPSVSVAPTSHTFETTNVGETATQEFTITAKNTTATLSASIDNTTDFAISAITGDKVTVTYQPQSAGDHTATMTVKAGEEASTTVALTGKAVAALEGTWILVTDASSLKAGDEIIIAAKDYAVALSTTQANNNRPEVAITKNDNTITATSETQVLTLQAGNKENTLALYTGDGYLYAASSGSNYLRTETTLSDNSSWSIAVAADGTATLIAQGDNTRNTIFYNQSSKLFACYANNTTNQKAITLYKKTNGQQLAGLAYETTKYLTKLGETFATPVLANPNAVDVTYESSDNNVATVAADGAVTINAAGIATITASFAGNSSFLEGSAKYTICVTEHAGTEADPYTVADARRVIDVMETAEGVYANGIVSEIVTAYNEQYGNISYNISADGLTTSDQLQAYRGKSYDGANFTSPDDVKVGDEVVIKGTLKKFSTTYEFDENNQLVSLNRTKEQAGLAYAETEHTANVGEDFAEPALTNPNNLTVTYSSSNTTLATVNATTGEVTIIAAGKVTITATTAGDATYAAGSASYNITITDPSLAVATLPFTFNSGKADIENTAGMTQEGLGDDYNSAPKLRFNGADDNVIVHFDSQAGEFSFLLKQNGSNAGTFTVYESANGEDYTSVWSGGNIGNTKSETITPTLAESSRYVKFEYTTKGEGTNYALGSISIAKPDNRQEAGLAWDPETVTLTVGEEFTAPTLQYPNDITGTITYESSNDEVATVTTEGVIALASAIGTATITATYAGNETYKPATATCTITVNEYIETIDGEWQLVTDASKLQAGMEIIIASVADAGAVKTMGEQGNNNRSAVASTVDGDKLNPAVGTTVITLEDCQLYEGLFALKTKDGYLYAASTSSNHLRSQGGINDNACWTITVTEGVASVVATNSSNHNVMRYNETSDLFSCYDENNNQKDIAIYAKVPDCTREIPVGYYGTVCLPSNIIKVLGATLYEVAGKEDNGRVVFDEVLDPEVGMPYIFLSHNAEVLFYCGTETATEAGKHNSLQGTFDEIAKAETNELTGNYMVVNNIIKKCGARCGLGANRAYFIATELELLGTAPAPMPGRRRVTMGVTGENGTTDLDNITTTNTPVKVIENGKLIIIRDGVKYNVQGVRL